MGLSTNILRSAVLVAGTSTMNGCFTEFPGLRGDNPSCCTDAGGPDAEPTDTGSNAPTVDLGLPEGCEAVEVEAICKQVGARAMLGPDHNCCPSGYEEVAECEDTKDCHCCVPTEGEIPIDSKPQDGGMAAPNDAMITLLDGGETPTADSAPVERADASLDIDASTPADGSVCGENVMADGNSLVRCADGNVSIDASPLVDATIISDASVVQDSSPLQDALTAEAGLTPDASTPADAAPVPDAFVAPESDAFVEPEPDAFVAPDAEIADICPNGRNALEVDFGADGATLTMFGQPPVRIRGRETRTLSCENFKLGIPFNFILDGSNGGVEAQINVRGAIADVGLGIWTIDSLPPNFQNAGQPPNRPPTIAIQNGAYANGQAYEGYYPYTP